MKNRTLKKLKKKMNKRKIKGSLLMEMAEDIVDIITNAKIYKQIKKRK